MDYEGDQGRLGEPVDVRGTDGRWYPGILDARRWLPQNPDASSGDQVSPVWEGWVEYTVAVGSTYRDWLPRSRLRPATWFYPGHPQPDQG